MSPRNTLIMFLVVLGLGAFWYFHDVKGGQEKQEAKALEERLFPDLEAEQVTRLALVELGKGEKPRLVLEKVDGLWHLRGDQDLLASREEIGGLAELVATLKRESVVNESAAAGALAQYGLEKPKYRLEVGTSQAGRSYQLLLGDKTPDESGYYARTGDKAPVVDVASMFMTTLEKPVPELREKSSLALEPSAVTRVVIKPAQGPEVVLSKVEGPKVEGEEGSTEARSTWRLESPVQLPADARKVSDYLWAWKTLSAGRFLAPQEKVDFSHPALRIEVTAEAGGKPQVLEVGPDVQVKPGMVYLQRSSPVEAMVVELGEKKAQLLAATADAFEDRHLLGVVEEDVDRLEVTLGDQEIQARRIRDGWEVSSPTQVTKDENLRNSAVSDLLYEAKDLQWATRGGTGAPASLDKPRARMKFLGKAGDVLGSVQIGGPAPGGGVWAAREGVPGVVTLATDPVSKWQEALRRLQGAPTGASPAPPPSSPRP